MSFRPVRLLPLVLALVAAVAPAPSRASGEAAQRAESFIAGLDYEQARNVLASADADDPAIAVERARLAIYELDCDGAVAILGRAELAKSPGAAQLADVARGCQRVIASLAVDRDDARGIEVRWQDEHDRALAPLLFETVAAARDALSRDLGVDWPKPTRVVVVRDLLSLSAMTGLPYKSAQTTGTVAVAKWGRVTLLSPRASRHGYSWRDTVAHELTHLAVTRASGDHAPLWLQEGVAKREEVRWRDPGPFDDRPPVDAVVRRGEAANLALPLDRLGPSIAMLPSADAAMVAFAEVTSFVRFYADQAGDGALPKLLHELRGGKEPDAALLAASGADLKTWDGRWRAYRAAHPVDPAGLAGLELGAEHAKDKDRVTAVRDRSRLAELLMARQHAPEALIELDHLAAPASGAPDPADGVAADPSLRWLRARALEAAGRRDEGRSLVADPKLVSSSFAPWWATRGRWARAAGEDGVADASFREAVAADPFDPEGACESIDPAGGPKDPTQAPLCAAARAAGNPPFDD